MRRFFLGRWGVDPGLALAVLAAVYPGWTRAELDAVTAEDAAVWLKLHQRVREKMGA